MVSLSRFPAFDDKALDGLESQGDPCARAHPPPMYRLPMLAEPVEGFQVEAVVSLRDILSDPEWLKQQAWAQPALALDQMGGIGGLVWSIVDKYVCVYADMFWGSPGSTFSGEIDWTLRRYEFQGYIKQR